MLESNRCTDDTANLSHRLLQHFLEHIHVYDINPEEQARLEMLKAQPSRWADVEVVGWYNRKENFHPLGVLSCGRHSWPQVGTCTHPDFGAHEAVPHKVVSIVSDDPELNGNGEVVVRVVPH